MDSTNTVYSGLQNEYKMLYPFIMYLLVPEQKKSNGNTISQYYFMNFWHLVILLGVCPAKRSPSATFQQLSTQSCPTNFLLTAAYIS